MTGGSRVRAVAKRHEARAKRLGLGALALLAIVVVVLVAFRLSDSRLTQPEATAIAGLIAGSGATLAASVSGFMAWKTRQSLERQITQTGKISDTELVQQREEARDRHNLAEVQALRDRFITASDQLGHQTAAIRIAGVYAVASVADDWIRRDTTLGRSEAQVCIDVLCAYMRTPWPAEGTHRTAEASVRQTIVGVITNHLQDAEDPVSWADRTFDFSGATFEGNYSFDRATFRGKVRFDGATFTAGKVRFVGARFESALITFDRAKVDGGALSFDRATFAGKTVRFEEAEFISGVVTFGRATFSGGRVWFTRAKFNGAEIRMNGSEFSGSTVGFLEAEMNDGCIWFGGSVFRAGEVSLDRAFFRGGEVVFRNSIAIGDKVVLNPPPHLHTEFAGGQVTGPWTSTTPPEVWPPTTP